MKLFHAMLRLVRNRNRKSQAAAASKLRGPGVCLHDGHRWRLETFVPFADPRCVPKCVQAASVLLRKGECGVVTGVCIVAGQVIPYQDAPTN